MVGLLRWMGVEDSGEAEAVDQSKVACEIQSSNQEVSQHIGTFRVI